MREIKFRGMSVKDKKWVYGYHWVSPKSEHNVSFIIESYYLPATHNTNARQLTRSVEVIPETVIQFIGLTDKHKKEFYEGDVITKTGREFLVIEFENGGYHANAVGGGASFHISTCVKEYRIVDNIYKNKDWRRVYGRHSKSKRIG